jgi:hypothetical protein
MREDDRQDVREQPETETCHQCDRGGDLTRDEAGLSLCKACRDDILRQQQFIDWGFGEAPDDLG